MGKLKRWIKKIVVMLIELMLPIISKIEYKADVEKAKSQIFQFDTGKEIYNEESLKREVNFDDLIDLSIIIPIFNAEKTLEMCLNSIINQKTQYTFEVILVNDGSTDASNEILKDYEQKYSQIIVLEQENGGAGKARNTGINHARRNVYWFYR